MDYGTSSVWEIEIENFLNSRFGVEKTNQENLVESDKFLTKFLVYYYYYYYYYY